MFTSLREMGLYSRFNPMPLFKKFSGKGIEDETLEDAITAGVLDAYIKFDPMISENFGPFAYKYALGAITAIYRDRKRCRNYSGWCVTNRSGKAHPRKYEETIPDPHNSVSKFDEAIDRVTALFEVKEILAFIHLAFPEQPAPDFPSYIKNNRKRLILEARYCRRLGWNEVAEEVDLDSKQAAQWHDRHARQQLLEFIQSDAGKSALRKILDARNVDEGVLEYI